MKLRRRAHTGRCCRFVELKEKAALALSEGLADMSRLSRPAGSFDGERAGHAKAPVVAFVALLGPAGVHALGQRRECLDRVRAFNAGRRQQCLDGEAARFRPGVHVDRDGGQVSWMGARGPGEGRRRVARRAAARGRGEKDRRRSRSVPPTST